MKYYIVEVSEGDPTIKGYAVYAKDSEKEAVALFHQKLASAMKSELFTSELLLVMDEHGKVLKREEYKA